MDRPVVHKAGRPPRKDTAYLRQLQLTARLWNRGRTKEHIGWFLGVSRQAIHKRLVMLEKADQLNRPLHEPRDRNKNRETDTSIT